MFADRSHTTIGGQVSESYFHEIPDRQWQLLHGPSSFIKVYLVSYRVTLTFNFCLRKRPPCGNCAFPFVSTILLCSIRIT